MNEGNWKLSLCGIWTSIILHIGVRVLISVLLMKEPLQFFTKWYYIISLARYPNDILLYSYF